MHDSVLCLEESNLLDTFGFITVVFGPDRVDVMKLFLPSTFRNKSRMAAPISRVEQLVSSLFNDTSSLAVPHLGRTFSTTITIR